MGFADNASLPTGADTLSGLPPPQQITLTTVYKSALVVEGLTADSAGNLYAPGRGGANPCPIWRVATSGETAAVVGNIAGPCNPAGLAFNAAGDLFVADGDKIDQLTPNEQTPPNATVLAAGLPGANGIAFDRGGNLWVTDGATGQGRVWRVTPAGAPSEVLRVQPLANEVNVVAGADAGVEAGVGGIGRDNRALPPGSITVTATARVAADTAGSQPIVANGIAFGPDGSLFVADTGRGAIWKVALDSQGAVTSPVGCDTTFTQNTLCLEDVLVAHPMLEGLDGIAVDAAGNIWGAANERNAIVVVTPQGKVREVFRNPPDATSRLRNSGPLEFPTSPFLIGRKLCVTQSDTNRRDNFPSSGGEVGPGMAGPLLGKISCVDQAMPQTGLTLPVR
jgi:sugar lactone lactonase YvrE